MASVHIASDYLDFLLYFYSLHVANTLLRESRVHVFGNAAGMWTDEIRAFAPSFGSFSCFLSLAASRPSPSVLVSLAHRSFASSPG